MFWFVTLFVLAFALTTACSTKQESSLESHQISAKVSQPKVNYLLGPSEFKKKQSNSQNLVLLDVRTPDEYRSGTIVGSQNLDYYSSNFKSELSKMDKTNTVLVFCHVGGRSAGAKSILNQMGFENVFDLEGGIVAWQRAGYVLTQQN